MKVLILIPGKNARGGITNYYASLKDHFSLPVDYLERGARTWPDRTWPIRELFRVFKDAWKFLMLVRTGKYGLVQTTTSFSNMALLRDGLFILIAKFYRVKIIVFYRGWDMTLTDKIERKHLGLFKKVYFKADAVIELAKANIEKLRSWGYTKPCYLETTVVDQKLLYGIDEEFILNRSRKDPSRFNMLFLSRIEITKGIYEAIDTYKILKKSHQNLSMTIAGDGSELENIKRIIDEEKLNGIIITGFVEKNEKAEIFMKADIFIFPSYFEGMPNAVLEAMSFGIPVITRPVGGVADFFINGKNGFLTESKEPAIFADLLEKLLSKGDLYSEICINNYKQAMNNFISSVVVRRIEKIFTDTLEGSSPN
jgi:glycosyltransferase involved in cell wall biosynthesis